MWVNVIGGELRDGVNVGGFGRCLEDVIAFELAEDVIFG